MIHGSLHRVQEVASLRLRIALVRATMDPSELVTNGEAAAAQQHFVVVARDPLRDLYNAADRVISILLTRLNYLLLQEDTSSSQASEPTSDIDQQLAAQQETGPQRRA